MALAAALALASLGAHAMEVYVQGGTEGAGIGFGQTLNQYNGFRSEFNGFGLSRSFSAGSVNYSAKLSVVDFGTYYDLFPFGGAFRLTTGFIVNNDRISGTASDANGITINGTTYSGAGEGISATAKMPHVMPYLGLGFGHGAATTKGFGLTTDIGVAFGRPSLDYSVTPGLAAAAGQANIDAERQQVQNKLNRVKFFPVIKVGIRYVF
ncbi:hypothetical protein F6X40_23935 [Paraburkholderia sp. UCT31]|uniref:hypothetical protein n=1 Tax=Paraburkholderia sp. UCT31 TaxID=2615209 RepID=UPI0016551745|nr:hypothetical protein [Paraburkholderia sp. UCT31]MBC8739767.1 hypothetical protein [Paraburkholderia sp. UCT31]